MAKTKASWLRPRPREWPGPRPPVSEHERCRELSTKSAEAISVSQIRHSVPQRQLVLLRRRLELQRICHGQRSLVGRVGRVDARDLRPARAPGHAAERAVELGYHETQGSRHVDLVLPVRPARRLQPLRAGLDGRHGRERRPRRAAHGRLGRQAGHRCGHARRPRRSGQLDALHAGRAPARRPRDHQESWPAPHLQRQPVFRGPVQDAQVPPRLSRLGSAPSRTRARSTGASSPGTTRSTVTRASG